MKSATQIAEAFAGRLNSGWFGLINVTFFKMEKSWNVKIWEGPLRNPCLPALKSGKAAVKLLWGILQWPLSSMLETELLRGGGDTTGAVLPLHSQFWLVWLGAGWQRALRDRLVMQCRHALSIVVQNTTSQTLWDTAPETGDVVVPLQFYPSLS